MRRKLILLSIMIFVYGTVSHAGGGSLTTLSFLGANSESCGTWQATGSLSTSSHIRFIMTDGAGFIVSEGTVDSIHRILEGKFDHQPVQNPLTLLVFSDRLLVGNLQASNPCIADHVLPVHVQNNDDASDAFRSNEIRLDFLSLNNSA